MCLSGAQGSYVFPEEQGGEGQTFITGLEQRVIVQATMWEKPKPAVSVAPRIAGNLAGRLLNSASSLPGELQSSLALSLVAMEWGTSLCSRAVAFVNLYLLHFSQHGGRHEGSSEAWAHGKSASRELAWSSSLHAAGQWEWRIGYGHPSKLRMKCPITQAPVLGDVQRASHRLSPGEHPLKEKHMQPHMERM